MMTNTNNEHSKTIRVAGEHILLDLFTKDETFLSDMWHGESILKHAALEAKATILGSNFHEFGEGSGYTGVLVLSESHISIHTWPEFQLATIDIFMCGDCDPAIANNYILQNIEHYHQETNRMVRGILK